MTDLYTQAIAVFNARAAVGRRTLEAAALNDVYGALVARIKSDAPVQLQRLTVAIAAHRQRHEQWDAVPMDIPEKGAEQ